MTLFFIAIHSTVWCIQNTPLKENQNNSTAKKYISFWINQCEPSYKEKEPSHQIKVLVSHDFSVECTTSTKPHAADLRGLLGRGVESSFTLARRHVASLKD